MPMDSSTTAPVAGTIPAVDPAAAAAGAAPPVGATTAPPRVQSCSPGRGRCRRVGFWRRAPGTLLDTILLGVIPYDAHHADQFILWVLITWRWAWRAPRLAASSGSKSCSWTDVRWTLQLPGPVFGAVFSTIVIGLAISGPAGIRQQGWHDKIAGTSYSSSPSPVAGDILTEGKARKRPTLPTSSWCF